MDTKIKGRFGKIGSGEIVVEQVYIEPVQFKTKLNMCSCSIHHLIDIN